VTEQTKVISLSQRELLYLVNSSFLDASLRQIVAEASPGTANRRTISVPANVAEAFRAAFTDRLAEVGFDGEYNLTSEGKMLEDLIDRFFIGE
jgi:hypothetical protein